MRPGSTKQGLRDGKPERQPCGELLLRTQRMNPRPADRHATVEARRAEKHAAGGMRPAWLIDGQNAPRLAHELVLSAGGIEELRAAQRTACEAASLL